MDVSHGCGCAFRCALAAFCCAFAFTFDALTIFAHAWEPHMDICVCLSIHICIKTRNMYAGMCF